jgi:hypothetical protein
MRSIAILGLSAALLVPLAGFARAETAGFPAIEPIDGVTIETKVRRMSPADMVEITVYVEKKVKGFDHLNYQCEFLGKAGPPLSYIPLGVVARMSFKSEPDGPLVHTISRTLPGRGIENARCRVGRVAR